MFFFSINNLLIGDTLAIGDEWPGLLEAFESIGWNKHMKYKHMHESNSEINKNNYRRQKWAGVYPTKFTDLKNILMILMIQAHLTHLMFTDVWNRWLPTFPALLFRECTFPVTRFSASSISRFSFVTWLCSINTIASTRFFLDLFVDWATSWRWWAFTVR